MKTGRLSKDEQAEIRKLAEKEYSAERIANKLGRRLETIQNWMELNVRPVAKTTPDTTRAEIRQDLRKSLVWKNLEKEFAPDELAYFEEEYIKLMAQFKDDILPSEEKQVFDYLKTDILMSRCLQKQKRSKDHVESMRTELSGYADKYKDEEEIPKHIDDRIAALNSHITFMQSTEQTAVNEWTRLAKEKDNIGKALKMARDQRVHNVISGKKFVDIVQMLQRKETQEAESRHMEIIRRGTEAEKKRLAAPYKYVNGEVDLPLLTPETWKEYEDSQKEEES